MSLRISHYENENPLPFSYQITTGPIWVQIQYTTPIHDTFSKRINLSRYVSPATFNVIKKLTIHFPELVKPKSQEWVASH